MSQKELKALLKYIDAAIEDVLHASHQSYVDKAKAPDALKKMCKEK